MGILVERHYDGNNTEIMLKLPQGDSYILANRNISLSYEIIVVLPWYGSKFFTGIESTVIHDELDCETSQNIINAPNSDLIAIIREALHDIKKANHELDLEM